MVVMQTIVVATDSLGFKPHTAADAPAKMMAGMETAGEGISEEAIQHSTALKPKQARRSLGVRMKAVVVFALNKTG